MREKAFTLVEVMVVMAIISILAGMMTPMVWKFWESEEIATTRQRMRDLKIAMVGDKTLIQNGIRTHYGFVGDNGELPFGNHSSASGNLAYLVIKPTADYPNWNGPYLSGFDSNWYRDAWGQPFRYTPEMDINNRYVRAELRSAGPDRIFDNSDDIVDYDVQLNESEVTPTDKILVNVPSGSVESLKLSVSFQENYGITTPPLLAGCINKLSYARYTTLTVPKKVPVGGIDIVADHYDGTCPGTNLNKTGKLKYFVNDNMKQINISNLP